MLESRGKVKQSKVKPIIAASLGQLQDKNSITSTKDNKSSHHSDHHNHDANHCDDHHADHGDIGDHNGDGSIEDNQKCNETQGKDGSNTLVDQFFEVCILCMYVYMYASCSLSQV